MSLVLNVKNVLLKFVCVLQFVFVAFLGIGVVLSLDELVFIELILFGLMAVLMVVTAHVSWGVANGKR